MRPSLAAAAWALYLACSGALAAFAVAAWLDALLTRRLILYGEGAVANAARLARDRAAYLDLDPTRFVAANYPPLYFHLASLGDPFAVGRAASIAATIGVAVLIFAAARGGGILVAASLAAGWLALAPVTIWGPAVKPDLIALFLTALAVFILDRRPSRAAVAGFLLVMAALAKPTALLPAAALAAWVAFGDRSVLLRFAAGVGVGGVAAGLTLALDSLPDVWRHVVVWNQLDWSATTAFLLGVVALIVLGAGAAVALLARGFAGARAAYGLSAVGIIVLGGRDGATINYLLDASVAIALALAAAAPGLRTRPLAPIVGILGLAAGLLLLNPLRIVPGRVPTTGAWSEPSTSSVQIAFHTTGGERFLVEDSGILVRAGIEPVVDDIFLWSRLAERGTIDPGSIVAQAREGRFAAVLTEADLEHLDQAPAYERQRWSPVLVRAVVDRYRLERQIGTQWLYVPR